MSSYGGGVSVSVASPLKSDIGLGAKISGSISLRTASGASGSSVATFWNILNRVGVSQILPANISAGVELLNVTGAGFLCAVVLPAFSVASGTFTLEIERDGEIFLLDYTCTSGTTVSALLFSPPATILNSPASTVNNGVINGANVEIQCRENIIAVGDAVRFTSNLRISIQSATAVTGTAELDKAGVIYRMDSDYYE